MCLKVNTDETDRWRAMFNDQKLLSKKHLLVNNNIEKMIFNILYRPDQSSLIIFVY